MVSARNMSVRVESKPEHFVLRAGRISRIVEQWKLVHNRQFHTSQVRICSEVSSVSRKAGVEEQIILALGY